MRDREDVARIVEEIDYLLAKRRQRKMERLCLVVTHGYRRPGTDCMPGETVEQANLAIGSKEFPLLLSPTGLLIVDCIARHHRTPLAASHIERILHSERFYLRHGANAIVGGTPMARPRRDSIKTYIRRLRLQVARLLKEAGLNSNPDRVLASERTDSNVVVYRLNVRVEIAHQSAG